VVPAVLDCLQVLYHQVILLLLFLQYHRELQVALVDQPVLVILEAQGLPSVLLLQEDHLDLKDREIIITCTVRHNLA